MTKLAGARPALFGALAASLVAGSVAAAATPQPAPAASVVAGPAQAKPRPWWDHAVIYEIYVRSFQDSNGDGVGDLKGITRRLDYLQKLGVDAIWITPFFPSPNKDFGYDVADYTNVAPEYGTMADWDELAREAKKRGIRILVDFVLNHSSDQHPWFKESRSSRDNPKRDWYVWKDPTPDGGPPTNWQSIFGGSTWEYDKATGQYYYHVFYKEQPDLNWSSPGLRQAMEGVMRFWLDRGASGFRLDATPYLFEDSSWPNDPDVKAGPPVGLKPYNSNLAATREALRGLRRVVDGYPGERVLLGENAISTIADLRAVYGAKADEINQLRAQLLQREDLAGDGAEHRAGAAVLVEGIDAEARQALDLEREVALQRLFVGLALRVVHDVVHHVVHLLVLERVDIDAAHIAVHPDHRWQSGGQVQVRRLVLDRERQQLGDVHGVTGCTSRGSGAACAVAGILSTHYGDDLQQHTTSARSHCEGL